MPISNNSFIAVGFNFTSENVMQLRKIDTTLFFGILNSRAGYKPRIELNSHGLISLLSFGKRRKLVYFTAARK